MTTSFGVAGTPTRVPNPPARASRSMQARGADVTASLGRYAASAAARRGALRRDSPVNRARHGGHRGERFQPARAGLGEALGEHAARVNLENIPNLASSTVTQTQTSSVDDSVARLSTDFSNAIAEVSLGHELEYLAAHPAHLCALAISCGAVYYIITRGRQKIRRLKAEFLSHGIDLTNVDDRLDTLTYLKKMQDQGMLPLGLEVCAMKQAEMEVLFMGNDGVAKWKKYYAERGIEVASAGDLDRVRKYVENLHHLEGCLLGIDMEALSN